MDITVLEWISSVRPSFLDPFFLAVTKLGSEMLPIILMCVVFWCFDRKYSTRVLFTVLFSLLANQLLKLIFLVKRPWLRSDKIIPVEKALPDATGYSFPSGHTANITACMGSLGSFNFPVWAMVCGWAVVFLVAVSRLYLCVHTPTDVIVSFIITLVIILLAKKLTELLEKKPSLDLPLIIFSLTAAAAVIILAFIQPDGGTNSRSDVLKLAGACAGGLMSWYINRHFIPMKSVTNLKSALLRIIPGLILTLIVLEGSKPLFVSLIGDTAGGLIRYCLTTFTAFCVWPYIFTKAKF